MGTLTSIRFSKLEKDWQEVIVDRETEFLRLLKESPDTLPSKLLARFERDYPEASEQVSLAFLL